MGIILKKVFVSLLMFSFIVSCSSSKPKKVYSLKSGKENFVSKKRVEDMFSKTIEHKKENLIRIKKLIFILNNKKLTNYQRSKIKYFLKRRYILHKKLEYNYSKAKYYKEGLLSNERNKGY